MIGGDICDEVGRVFQADGSFSDIPGNKEWIVEGENGWIFRDGDADDLANQILKAIKNRRSLKKIGESSRKTAEQKADWKKNFGKLLKAYDEVLSP